HYAPSFGFVCGSLGIDGATAARMFVFLNARDMLSAANR
ncbi:unnamed protein product, partial [Phaeothamnion confervicola]